MALTDIKAVFFDAYGTLFDVNAPVARLAEKIGPDADAISALWRSKQLQYSWLHSLMQAHDDFETVTADALDFALARYNIDDFEIRDRLLSLYLTLDAYPDAISALNTLKDRGIRTGILSNGSPYMLASAVDSARIGDLLDHVLSVETVGIYKPHPSVYQLAVDSVALEVNQIGFVSANGWDAAGAAHFGFQVIHLNRFDQPPEKLPAGPALILKSLDQAADAMLG